MKNILVVEDDQFIGDVTSQKLVAAGHEVTMATTGAMAQEKIASYSPDVILLDLDLPDMSGVEILKAVKANGATPVYIFSNNDDQAIHDEVMAAGADAFYVKASTDFSTILTALESLA